MIKGSKAKTPYKRLDVKTKDFILSKMAEGMDVQEISREY